MWYEINVSHNGTHVFATSQRSLTDKLKLRLAHSLFLTKFPKGDGYEILVIRRSNLREVMSLSEIYE